VIKPLVPGSPSQVGSKPGDEFISTIKLVASRGLGGSNPPPGAISKEEKPRLFNIRALSIIAH